METFELQLGWQKMQTLTQFCYFSCWWKPHFITVNDSLVDVAICFASLSSFSRKPLLLSFVAFVWVWRDCISLHFETFQAANSFHIASGELCNIIIKQPPHVLQIHFRPWTVPSHLLTFFSPSFRLNLFNRESCSRTNLFIAMVYLGLSVPEAFDDLYLVMSPHFWSCEVSSLS